MTRRRWWLVALLLVSAGFAAGGQALLIANDANASVLDLLSGLSFIVAGVIAIDRRPGNRIGPLMVAAGVTSFALPYQLLKLPILTTVVPYVAALSTPLVVQIVFAYPSGRLQTRFERLLVAGLYVEQLADSAAIMLFWDPRQWGCADCAPVPAPWPSLSSIATVNTLNNALTVVLASSGVVALLLRYRRASPIERRDLRPLWVAATLLAASFIADGFEPNDSTSGVASALSAITSALLIAVPVIFLIGLLSAWTAKTAIGDLVLQLDPPVPPGRLGLMLAKALSDPSLRILYATDAGAGWIDGDGTQQAELKTLLDRNQTVTRVERDGRPYAALVHDRALNSDLVAGAATAAGIALENEWLHAELRNQLEEIRASRSRIVAAGDDQRRRVERDLHDGAQQRLLTVSLALHTARSQAATANRESQAQIAETISRASDELKLAIDELRELARGIHPTILTNSGLEAAVRSLAGRSALTVTIRANIGHRLPDQIEATGYFIVSEALANIAKHSAADTALIRLDCRDGILHIAISDTGLGGADPNRGTGLRGLQDRAAAVNGTLTIISTPTHGTTITAELPVGPTDKTP